MFWDPVFEKIASIAGAPLSQIKLITVLLAAFPIASLYGRLPVKRYNVAHIFSIIVSTIFLVPVLGLGNGVLHLLFSCVGIYLIVVILRGPVMPWTAFIFGMSHLLYNHIIRLRSGVPTSEIEITFTQMVLVMNLTTFAWNVHDGRRKIEELDASQRATRLDHVPTPLAFFGYCFFFPAMLIGPSFDYATYDSLIRRTLYQTPPTSSGSQTASSSAQAVYANRRPSGRRRVAYLKLVMGLLFLGYYSTYGAQAEYERILSPAWDRWTWLQKFGFIQFAGFTARTKYYAVWSLSEGACILTGLGFNGYDQKTGRSLWNRVQNVNILSIESAESFKMLFDNWNCRTNVWLRDCVYKRLTAKGKKPGTMQSMATFMTSAVWHGIEPGYHMTFVTAGLLTSLGRQFRHFVRPYFLPPPGASSSPSKRFYDVIGWFMVQTNLNYLVSSFMLLSLKKCMTAWSRMGWYSHIIIALSYAFFQLGGRRRLRKGLEGRQQKPNPSLKISPPSPAVVEEHKSPRNAKDMRWVKDALEDKGEQGVHPDGGLVDSVMRGAETPGWQTPGSAAGSALGLKEE